MLFDGTGAFLHGLAASSIVMHLWHRSAMLILLVASRSHFECAMLTRSVSAHVLAGVNFIRVKLAPWHHKNKLGDLVRIHGLSTVAGRAWNCQVGTVLTFDDGAGRYRVKVPGVDDPKGIKPVNLSQEIAPLLDAMDALRTTGTLVWMIRKPSSR